MSARTMTTGICVLAMSLASACGTAAEADRAVPPGPATSTATSGASPTSAPTTGASPTSTATVGLTAPATATTPAVRVDPPPRTTCEAIARRVAEGRREADHLVIVHTAEWRDTTAVLQIAERSGSTWTCGPELTARLGDAGYRPLRERRSGDGTTPAGVFPLGTMTAWDGQRFSFFGNDADPGVTAGAYRRVRSGDCFGAAPGTPGYGHLRFDTSCPGPDDEYLPRFVQAYTNAALIGANMEPDVSGDAPGEIPYAAAIFLHRHVYAVNGTTRPTSGCVSLAQADLTRVLVGMQPDSLFVMGPTDWLLGEGGGA